MIRVVLSGVESVGKSTLADQLVQHFEGLLVPEYGRTYTESLRRDLTLEDHYAIAEGHAITADQVASAKPTVLVEDTDIVMTTAWATMLFGQRDAILALQPSSAHIHLLLHPDVPFVSDPVRMFGNEKQRQKFHQVIVDEFAQRGLTPVNITGSWETRLQTALHSIEALL